MKDDRDYKLELSSAAVPPPPEDAAPSSLYRPFLSVHFACCNVYLRIYRDAEGSAYQGRCPRCGQRVHFAVGPGGTRSRTFRVE